MIIRADQFDTAIESRVIRPDQVAPDPQVSSIEPLAVSMRTMCSLLSVSENTIKAMVKQGLPVVRLAGKNLFPVQLVREWLAEQAKKGKA